METIAITGWEALHTWAAAIVPALVLIMAVAIYLCRGESR